MLSPSYIILRIQRLESKQCRSRWGGSLWATSSRSTLFANSALSSLVVKELDNSVSSCNDPVVSYLIMIHHYLFSPRKSLHCVLIQFSLKESDFVTLMFLYQSMTFDFCFNIHLDVSSFRFYPNWHQNSLLAKKQLMEDVNSLVSEEPAHLCRRIRVFLFARANKLTADVNSED